ncbi:hypothetical protein [Azospirillum argentinense]|uniref:hypothetical protein n=1 Tax=Azospirillum argentinense TaxID=2970906 RepID=UPI0010BF7CC5|nr:hypothetical protein [Azospirillum argentinense]
MPALRERAELNVPEWMRAALAFAFAPLMASIAYVSPILAGVGLMYAYTGALIFGFPIYLFFRKRKFKNVLPYILIVAGISFVHSWIVTFLFLFVPHNLRSEEMENVVFYSSIIGLFAVWGGIIGGLTFWLILRPDKEEARKLSRMATR